MSLLIVAALAGAAGVACDSAPPARPNVLLVTIDTLRADHCSTYGYPVPTTPELTRLAESGVLFRSAYAVSATTAPSHASLLTGRHFRSLGVMKNGHAMGEDAQTLAESLAAQGYATAAFVSSFPVRSKFGFGQGFEVFDDQFVENEASFGRRNGGIVHDRIAEATTNRLLKWMKERGDDRPVFVWAHFVDPHFPYNAPQKLKAEWPEHASGTIRKYDSEVFYADRHLGRMIQGLEGFAGKAGTLVVVTSDHGEGLGDHGWKSHGINLYEEAVRIPLVARWAGHLPAGKVVETPVSLVDVAPSILAVLGAQPLDRSDGDNIFGTLDPNRSVHLQRRSYKNDEVRGVAVGGEMTAVVRGAAKFITAPHEQRRELYRLDADPKEQRNLLGEQIKLRRSRVVDTAAAPPAAPHVVAPQDAEAADAMDAELERWRQDHPVPEGEVTIDAESLKALRSLGYVE